MIVDFTKLYSGITIPADIGRGSARGEPTGFASTNYMEAKEFCGALRPSKELKANGANPKCPGQKSGRSNRHFGVQGICGAPRAVPPRSPGRRHGDRALPLRTLPALQAYLTHQGENSVSAARQAMVLIYRDLLQRAAALGYLDGFRVVAILLLVVDHEETTTQIAPFVADRVTGLA